MDTTDFEANRVKSEAAAVHQKSQPRDFNSSNFCRLGVQRDLHSDQGRNFESRFIQEVLQRLGVSKTRTTPLHPQSDGMVERYLKTAEEHTRKGMASHHRNWDASLPIFLLAYRASTHETTGYGLA
jgi:transposase InsO family protein